MDAFGMEFHNVDHLESTIGEGGKQLWKLCRFPEETVNALGTKENQKGKMRAYHCQGCEIRFILEGSFFGTAKMSFSCREHDVEYIVYRGDYFHERGILKEEAITEVTLKDPEIVLVSEHPAFSPKMWRIQFGMHGSVLFHSIEMEKDVFCRPPKKEEKPYKTWMAYGSSITSGGRAASYENTYVNEASRRLGFDLYNKGMAGSCLCEAEMITYLTGQKTDIFTVELGVNMIPIFSEKELEKRVEILFSYLKESRAKRIYIINLLPVKYSLFFWKEEGVKQRAFWFPRMVEKMARQFFDSRCRLIPGEEILQKTEYLSTDYVHPSSFGHIQMGIHLAQRISADLNC